MNWLLFRGLAREQRHWGDFGGIFCDTVPGARAHFLDFPGVGTENDRPCPATVAEIREDLRRRWLDLRDEHDGPWAILGVSLGGMVSMDWCAAHPGDFERLVVGNTSTGDLSAAHRRLSLDVVPQLLSAIFEADPVARERRVLGFTSHLCEDPDATARRAAQIAESAPIRRRTVFKQLLAAARFTTPAHIEPPTLILASARDAMADPTCALRLARHFEAPLVVHPTAGHDIGLDAPQWMARQIANWLR